jgi:hypothetical protein
MQWFPLIRPSRSQECQWWLPDPAAFELNRWRGGCCSSGGPPSF